MKVREIGEGETVTLDKSDDDDGNETVPANHAERMRQWTKKHRDDVSEEDSGVGENVDVMKCTCKSHCSDKLDRQDVENKVCFIHEIIRKEREGYVYYGQPT